MKVSRYSNLTQARDSYLVKVDDLASSIRGRHISSGIGQQAIYDRKEHEARKYLESPTGEFPWLEAEAAALSVNVGDVATMVISQASAWLYYASLIEALRVGTKQKVRQASTVREMHTHYSDAQRQMQTLSEGLTTTSTENTFTDNGIFWEG